MCGGSSPTGDASTSRLPPGFTPANVHREDDGPNPPPHDKHVDIYHMVQTHNWEAAKASDEKVYYPPTYATDGFTHATADPKYLLTVGNHFYKETKAPDGSGKPSEWKLLKMTRHTLEARKDRPQVRGALARR